MVAVPTVLGIASIRVYTVSEAPAEGLVTREKVRLSPNFSRCVVWQHRGVHWTAASQNNISPLSSAERLHTSAAGCPGTVCPWETRCYWEWSNCSQREHTAIGPGCKGAVCIYILCCADLHNLCQNEVICSITSCLTLATQTGPLFTNYTYSSCYVSERTKMHVSYLALALLVFQCLFWLLLVCGYTAQCHVLLVLRAGTIFCKQQSWGVRQEIVHAVKSAAVCVCLLRGDLTVW